MRQVGYLPELYEDARSEKYKKKVLSVAFMASRRQQYNLLSSLRRAPESFVPF